MMTHIEQGGQPHDHEDGITYRHTNDILSDARSIIESSQRWARHAVNVALVLRNWYLGKRIAEEELQGENRADYGKEVIKSLAKSLSAEFGKGFGQRELYYYQRFYRMFPEIVNSLSSQSGPLLSWTHYRTLLRVEDSTARNWYTHEAAEQGWSVRTLDRNISTQYYHRLLSSSDQRATATEMQAKTAVYQGDGYQKLEFIKDPYIMEFLGFSRATSSCSPANTNSTYPATRSCATRSRRRSTCLSYGRRGVPTQQRNNYVSRGENCSWGRGRTGPRPRPAHQLAVGQTPSVGPAPYRSPNLWAAGD